MDENAYRLALGQPLDLRLALRRAVEELQAALRADPARLRVPPAASGGRLRRGMHMHLLPELFLQLGGQTHFRCLGGDFVLAAGECCLMPRATGHEEQALPAAGRRFVNAVVMIFPGQVILHVARATAAQLPHAVGGQVHLPWAETDLPLEGLLDAAAARHATGTADGHDAAVALLLAVLALVKERLGENAIGGPAHLGRVDQCKALVRARLGEVALSVRALAAALGCSPDYLSHQFHAATGERLAAYINRQRLAQAKELLATTALSVSEVAWASGYHEPGYFIRRFRAAEGCSPRGWRQRRASTSP